ncbi:CSEP0091 putative effector protein [Blumeria hordei DH14]|uniref:CSEP0091 putative effector protein n=1 Tax=Blumeria graminis f. sp. hordei (strain DH14) TaxID=546991 RepID=N1JQ30_BLUG1|nr:CSEP0091 putative effector protein [Blumeria hordei DH14]
MKLLHFTEITAILSLFVSLCATQGIDDGYEMFNCRGVKFYSQSITNSATRAHNARLGSINTYPKVYHGTAGGPGPHRIFPMVRDEEVYSGGPLSFYFLIVDAQGQQQGVVQTLAGGHMPCEAY